MRERGLDDRDGAHDGIVEAGRLIDASEDARERAGGADLGAMADVGTRPGCLDVRPEGTLLSSFAERDEHDEQLRHQGQTAAEATKPVQP
jgi:hypothetical protein